MLVVWSSDWSGLRMVYSMKWNSILEKGLIRVTWVLPAVDLVLNAPSATSCFWRQFPWDISSFLDFYRDSCYYCSPPCYRNIYISTFRFGFFLGKLNICSFQFLTLSRGLQTLSFEIKQGLIRIIDYIKLTLGSCYRAHRTKANE